MPSNTFTHPVVAGVDGSASALNAALWAADEAAHRRAPLRLVYALMVSALALSGGLGAPQSFFAALEADGHKALSDAENAIRHAHPDLEVTTELCGSAAVPALVEDSETAQLLVLGSRGMGGFARALVGSTAVSLVAHGHCPVAVIRGRTDDEAPSSHGSVVVGVDGSPVSEPAIAMAFEEASARDAELVAVHTWIDLASDSAYAHAIRYITGWEDHEAAAHALLAERLAGWQEKYPEVAVRRVVAQDRPVRCLLAHAEDAQLLVIGSRGHNGFTGMLDGSTSQALMYHTPCPLLVVRPSTVDQAKT
jgi:nucleotide-binding universal stress UspA family protein